MFKELVCWPAVLGMVVGVASASAEVVVVPAGHGVLEDIEIAGRPLVWEDSWTPESGSLLVGSRGVVHTNAHNSICAVLPEGDFRDAAGPPRRLPSVPGHEREWMAACRGEGTPLSNFNHSGPAIELLLLGNVATLFEKPLEYDPMACRVVNSDEADRLLRPPRRDGWELSLPR